VRARWVEDLLADQFVGYEQHRDREVLRSVYLPLGMAWVSDLVTSTRSGYRMGGANPTPLPHDSDIAEVFERSGRSLLILGQPGAGKTVALAKLIEALLRRAEQDSDAPVPIGLFLRSWSVQAGNARTKNAKEVGDQERLPAWMSARLAAEYGMGREAARAWVEGGLVLPLLDGLDEVPEGALQEDCVRAINAYRPAVGMRHLAVTCRHEEYERLAPTARLALDDAALLQPYSSVQVRRYLSDMEREHRNVHLKLDAVRALYNDADCAALATNPLTLWAMCQVPADQLPQPATPETFLPALWERYVAARYRSVRFRGHLDQMAASPQHRLPRLWARLRSRQPARFPQERVERALAWVARMMSDHAQQPFYLEDMQPTWLEGVRKLRLYALAYGLIRGSLVLVPVTTGLVLLLGVARGLAVGTAFGAMTCLQTWWRGVRSWYIWLEPPEHRRWDPGIRYAIPAVLLSLAYTTSIGILIGAIFTAFLNFSWGLSYGIAFCMPYAVALALLTVYDQSFAKDTAPEQRRRPNEGLHAAWRQARVNTFSMVVVLGVASLVVRLLIWPLWHDWLVYREPVTASSLDQAQAGMPRFAVATGAFVLLLSVSSRGWSYVLRHMSLRYVLWRAGYIPAWLADLLEQAVALGLLSRVGGGYRFIHPTLQDWYAVRWEALRPCGGER
jgi:hypothetical protein